MVAVEAATGTVSSGGPRCPWGLTNTICRSEDEQILDAMGDDRKFLAAGATGRKHDATDGVVGVG